MARSPEQVLKAKRKAKLDADIPWLVALYAADAVAVTSQGALVGKAAIQKWIEAFYANSPNAKMSFGKTIVEKDICLWEWSHEWDTESVPHGVDTYYPGRVDSPVDDIVFVRAKGSMKDGMCPSFGAPSNG
jgi:hypothetical protein